MTAFDKFKRLALSGRSKEIGKLDNQWRFKYHPDWDGVRVYFRGYGHAIDKNDTDTAPIIFEINNRSECTVMVSNNEIDQTVQSFIYKHTHLVLKRISSTKIHKFLDTEYTLNDIYYKPCQVSINLNTNKIKKAPSYKTQYIDKEFNQLITNCSKKFRHEFTAMTNLLLASHSPQDLVKSRSVPLITISKMWEQMTSEIIDLDIIKEWYTYIHYNTVYFIHNDIRTTLQKVINERRYNFAKLHNKIIITEHNQQETIDDS